MISNTCWSKTKRKTKITHPDKECLCCSAVYQSLFAKPQSGWRPLLGHTGVFLRFFILLDLFFLLQIFELLQDWQRSVRRFLRSTSAFNMLFTRQALQPLLVSTALATGGYAQNYSDNSSATTTATASGFTTSTGIATHTVQVGPKSSPHAYVPHSLTANPGDVVVFEFYPTNHSVVKADFLAPCQPADGIYFYSGMFNSFTQNNGQLVGPVSMAGSRLQR